MVSPREYGNTEGVFDIERQFWEALIEDCRSARKKWELDDQPVMQGGGSGQ